MRTDLSTDKLSLQVALTQGWAQVINILTSSRHLKVQLSFVFSGAAKIPTRSEKTTLQFRYHRRMASL